MKTLHVKTSKLCAKLFKLERQGRYDEALSEIGDLWHDKNELPDTSGLSSLYAAELILRCGSIFGFLGHNKQIPNSQEKSRNLLSHARDLFIELYAVEKIAECENHLALAYWRTGEIVEANVWLNESLSRNLPDDNDAKIYAHLIKSLIALSAGEYHQIIKSYDELADKHFRYADNYLKGSFCTNVGAAYEKIGNTKKALEFLHRAHNYHLKSRHKIYLGTIQNNIAQIYKLDKNFPEAYNFVDNAINIFKGIKDRTREGFALDTKASIFFTERNFESALKTINKAIEIIGLGENVGYLIETLETKIKILVSMDDISSATFCLMEAVDIAKTQISEEKAKNIVSIYETCLREHLKTSNGTSLEENELEDKYSKSSEIEQNSFNRLELVLPSSLSKYRDIQGIWINNSHLEDVGLVRDSLAVVVPAVKAEKGDLIAIEEIENQNVSCGFYDNEFGIVCLEGHGSEPLLFDEEKINIIGKIIGVAIERTPDGKMIVEPISL